jgi:hypothetical protein
MGVKAAKMNIYIDYIPRKQGYCYGILGTNKHIKWNLSIYANPDRVKEEVYKLYPEAVIHVRD